MRKERSEGEAGDRCSQQAGRWSGGRVDRGQGGRERVRKKREPGSRVRGHGGCMVQEGEGVREAAGVREGAWSKRGVGVWEGAGVSKGRGQGGHGSGRGHGPGKAGGMG